MFSQLKLTKLTALFAVVISLFCTLQLPALAAIPIDMDCDGRAYGTVVDASDPQGAFWTNTCGKDVEFVVDYADGEWNYGTSAPYSTMVGPEGNPNGPIDGNFDNPTCNGAELSYLVNGEPIPGGCYSLDRSVTLEDGQTIQLLNNDGRGGHGDNRGEMLITNIRNF